MNKIKILFIQKPCNSNFKMLNSRSKKYNDIILSLNFADRQQLKFIN